MEKPSNTAERLKEIMKLKNLRQVDILELCKPFSEKLDIKLNKSDLSQYLSGKSEPNQNKLFLLAKGLNVSEAWLMGLNHPMERQDYTPPTTISAHATADLTPEEQDKVMEYIKFLKMQRGL